MDLQADINWIKSELDKVKDPSFVQVLKSLLNYRSKRQEVDWWEELSKDERREIEEGLAQADRGELTPHQEVMAKYDKWL